MVTKSTVMFLANEYGKRASQDGFVWGAGIGNR